MYARALWPGNRRAHFVAALGIAVAVLLAARPPQDAGPSLETAPVMATVQPVVPEVVRHLPSPQSLPFAGMPAESEFRRYAPIVDKASRTYGVDAALIHAVILAESSYDPDARSPAGASGLMQLMPGTAKHYGVKDIFDPGQNIRAGVKYLSELLRQFNGNVELALAAYNAGTSAVIRAGHRIPPVAETQAYVPKVIDHYRRLRALEG
jgi:soluble lytic murein transglycosylase-like protein